MNTLIDKKLHSKLKKIIAEDGTILFIGSGISAWSGLPNWKQLINEMADYVGKIGGDSTDIRYYSNNQPLIAADLGCAALNSNEFRDFIRSACRIDNAKPSIIHHLLVSLGVTCYITTNYDQLLEQTLEQNGLLNHYKIVTNRNPIDCAGLLHLSRRNFIFKPHGDIDQDESIVLSNKNYDDLYENGTKFHTYRALETLLTTRNVIFIGFGLTDPDFIRILGKIRNEFRTNLCTHYAIMPDISQNEQKYWLENYGIQILSYETKDKEHGRDHSALIELLKSLITKNRKQIERNIRIPSNSNSKITTEQKIALGRYAKYVIQQLKLPDGPTIPLMIKSENRFRDNYVYLQVDEVLKGNLSNFVITGNPSAGKTYFLKQYCLYRANRILECYNNSSSLYPKVPIYIDLKSYNGRGSIKNLIEAQFPPEIPINKWIEDRRVILVFDSFNEIDKRYLENRSCAQEIKQYSHRNDVIVATRYKSALDIYCHEYHLEEVKDEYVIEYLK